ncbi:FAD-dependent oxidoreductase, partial [Streptomyces boncukensis]
MNPTPARRLVVVGHGMVGHRLVETLLDRDADRSWDVTVLAEEARPAYDRVALSSCFDGADEGALRLPELPADRVSVRLGDPAAGIDREARAVTTASGVRLGYDALVLATGSRPFVPPVPGAAAPGVHVYRTLDDLDGIRRAAAASTTGRGVVVG